MTTVDVEESIVEEHCAAQEQDQPGDGTAGAWWRPAAGKAAPTGPRNGLQPPHVLVHGVFIGHVGGRGGGWQMGATELKWGVVVWRAQELLGAGIRIWGRSAAGGFQAPISADKRHAANCAHYFACLTFHSLVRFINVDFHTLATAPVFLFFHRIDIKPKLHAEKGERARRDCAVNEKHLLDRKQSLF